MAESLTLPHERELLAIVGLAVEAHEHDQDTEWLGVAICHSMQHVRHCIQSLHDATRWDAVGGHVKLFREGISVGNARIVLMSQDQPHQLRGLRPDKVLLLGSFGELWYLLKATEAPVEAVA